MRRLDSPAQAARWLTEHVRGELRTDHRQVRPGDGFLAWPGLRHDARQYVGQALAQGAAACLVEDEGLPALLAAEGRVASLRQLKAASGPVADAFHGHPSHAMPVIAVTGTNGKTSSTWWLAQTLGMCTPPYQRHCAVAGTLGIGFLAAVGADSPGLTPTGLTTPDAVLWQGALRELVARGAQACAVEASSIGLAEHRLDATRLHCAVFTNFTQDHLDYHGSMQAYWKAKESLFRWPDLRAAVINIDDPAGEGLARLPDLQDLDLWTVGRAGPARLRATEVHHTREGLQLRVREGDAVATLHTRIIGDYNASNLMGVLGALRSLGVPLSVAAAACEHLSPVPGRLQCFQAPGLPMGVIDYAHTPDALDKVLATLRPIVQARSGKLWCVFGCGGDRDPAKRSPMGRAAAAADEVVVTSDNPRSETPQAIIEQILPGLAGHTRVSREPDRAAAIADAFARAADSDVVLVAGKGHESTQEIGGLSHPFSDADHVQRALARRVRRVSSEGVAA